MAKIKHIKVFSGTPEQIESKANTWMEQNKRKVDVVDQKIKIREPTGTGHWNPIGILSVIYSEE